MEKKKIQGIVSVMILFGAISVGLGLILIQNNTNTNPLSNVRIACYNGNGVMEEDLVIIPNLADWIECEYEEISGAQIQNGELDSFDVLILPGGDGVVYWDDIGAQGKTEIKEFVNQGGGYLGICEGAYRACESAVWTDAPENLILGPENFLGLIPAVAWGPIFEIAERPEPGWGMAEIDIVNSTHPITDSSPETLTMYYQGGCYIVPDEGETLNVLGTYHATGEPAIAVAEYGQGRVFVSGPHPEVEEDDDRDGITFYEPEGEPWDPESDWPLLRDAISWLCEIPNEEMNSQSSMFGGFYQFLMIITKML